METRPDSAAVRCPYPGLRPFRRDETDLFFGREAQIEAMLAKLEDHRFLAVVGVSGCGKSSLVQAGLLPALEAGFLSDAGPDWRMAIMRPGETPFKRLAEALSQEAALGPERGTDPDAAAFLEAALRRGHRGLVEAVAETHLPEGTHLILVVDQFEEIFRYRRQAENSNDADAFVNLLLASAVVADTQSTPIYVVITMRSDFIGDSAVFTGLPEQISESQFLTPRLTRSQYRAAIEEPARLFGGELAPELVNQLLNDISTDPDQLPVLQHALMRMWLRAGGGTGHRLTLADYEAVGGLAGALSQHADEALQELNPAQQAIAKRLFQCLCERSAEGRDTRRPARLSEVAAVAGVEMEAVKPVVEVFRRPDRCFLTPPASVALTADTVLDISHESLIRQWRQLDAWVQEETGSAAIYQRLEDTARRRHEGKAALWREPDLDIGLQWRDSEHPGPDWAARYGSDFDQAMAFLDESQRERERELQEEEAARQRELDMLREREEFQRARAEEQAQSARRLRNRVKLGVVAAASVIAAIVAFLMMQNMVYENLIQEKKTTADIVTASIIHDIKYEYQQGQENPFSDGIIGKYITYYRIIKRISLYDTQFRNVADSEPGYIATITKDPDVILALSVAKPTIKIFIELDEYNLTIISIAPILKGAKIVAAVVVYFSIQDIPESLSAINHRVGLIFVVLLLIFLVPIIIMLRKSILHFSNFRSFWKNF